MKGLFYRAVKRLGDCVLAALALIVSSPLWLVCVVGIRLSSKGPLIYRSHRAGRRSEPFTMYKFRSMHVFQPQYEGQCSEGTFVGNSRIFRFGAFMRRSKLDELPQMLNVLLGQMSIVGPRPVSQESVDRHYTGDYACIMEAKPGLACLDSLFDYAHGELVISDDEQYRREIIPVRRELAKTYVERQSLATDLYCVCRTVRLIFEIVVLKKRRFPYTKCEAEARERVFGLEAAAK